MMRVLTSDAGDVVLVKPSSESAAAVSFSDGGKVEGSVVCNVLATPTREGGKPKRDYKRSQHHVSPRFSRRRLAGVRQVRRGENLAFLLDQAKEFDRDVDESGEVDFVDLMSSSKTSVFAELFLFEEKMSIWNEFINCSEEEQERILDRGVEGGRKVLMEESEGEEFVDLSLDDLDVSQEGLEQRVGGGTGTTNTVDRETRLAQSAKRCFARINHNLRCFLRHNHYPHGELIGLEAELVAFFSDWPTSVYVTQLSDGFRRLLLHAVSQYLDLQSISFDGEGGTRQTQVENKGGKGSFTPPKVSLSTYLVENKAKISGGK